MSQDEDFKEPFSECPECGYVSGIVAFPMKRPFFHFFCQKCGLEQSGTASYPLPDFLESEVEYLLVAKFGSLSASPKEMFALKKLCDEFKTSTSSEVKEKLRMRSQWTIGTFFEGEAAELIEKAKDLGLVIEKQS